MRVFAAALAIVVALLPVALHSQTADSKAAPAGDETASDEALSPSVSSEASSNAAATAADSEATAAAEDPFDYEASEQISEDLSVSFPVDI